MTKVSAALVFHNDKILLFHRDNIPTIKDPDCWDILGGHREEEETPEETLRRELQEEIGINPSQLVFLKDITDTWGSETSLFRVELTDQEASDIKLGDEGQGVEFFSLEELPGLKLTQNLKYYSEHALWAPQ